MGHLAYLRLLKTYSETEEATMLVADFHARLNNKGSISESVKKQIDFMKGYAPKVNVVLYSEMVDTLYLERLVQASRVISLRDLHRSLPEDLDSEHMDALRANKNPLLSPLLYVTMQMIDSKVLGCNMVLSGRDQRRIYMRQREIYKKLGWSTPLMVFYPLVVDGVQKMSKSKKCVSLDGKLMENLEVDEPQLKARLTKLLEVNPFWGVCLGISESIESYEDLKKFLLRQLAFLR